MKLLRYGDAGGERPAVLDRHGVVRDLSGELPDLGPEQLSPGSLRRLSQLDPSSLPAIAGGPRLGVPVAGIRKFIAVGLNYADHAAEARLPVPTEPVLFSKAISCPERSE
jgi:2,4-diketo-3-deoxy-L-fuconate hydrolase